MTSSSILPQLTKIPFITINFTVCNTHFNTSTSTFSVTQPSLYWFHLSAGVLVASGTNYSLNGLDYSAAVYSSATVYPQDQLTTDTLQWVWPNTILSVSNNQPLFSSSIIETAFLGFRLDNLFYPLVAFGVQLKRGMNSTGIIKFDHILINEGNRYNISEGTFVAPINGIYFFSAITSNYVQIIVKGGLHMAVCLCDSMHSSSDKVSTRGSLMLTLNANDRVQVFLNSLNIFKPAIQGDIVSFQGFLYSPRSGNQIAWSVFRTSLIAGPVDYLPFDVININKASCCWKSATNNVNIPTSGIYYIDMTSYPCGSAFAYCVGSGNNTIQVLHNGGPIITIRLAIATFDNCVSRSRSAIISLKAGDELRIRIPTSGCHYSDSQNGPQMTFNGFLLY